MTDAERDAMVERIRARGAARRDVKGAVYWHALFHAVSGRQSPTDIRGCEFCEAQERSERGATVSRHGNSKLRRELVNAIGALGWDVDGFTGAGHVRLRRRSDGRQYATAATPSDSRFARTKLLADLRRLNREER